MAAANATGLNLVVTVLVFIYLFVVLLLVYSARYSESHLLDN